VSIFAGDMAAAKKPDPAIYNLALQTLDLDAARTVILEDSAIGLHAAMAAGIGCIVTPSLYTIAEDFTGAARVVDNLENIRLADCAAVLDGG
jgi:beta-phosphoglucomutase-like phosphatase (HAD superfamily)